MQTKHVFIQWFFDVNPTILTMISLASLFPFYITILSNLPFKNIIKIICDGNECQNPKIHIKQHQKNHVSPAYWVSDKNLISTDSETNATYAVVGYVTLGYIQFR